MMKKPCTDRLRRLARIRAGTSSDEEFRLKAAVEGFGFWTTALFRLCLFRNEHPGLERLEFGALGFGVAGFSLWTALVGPKSALAGAGIILLALAVLVPLELLFLRFEELRLELSLPEDAG